MLVLPLVSVERFDKYLILAAELRGKYIAFFLSAKTTLRKEIF